MASWRFTNNWSLLRLLVAHASRKTDFDGFKDTKPHTLKFEVDVDRVDGKEPTGKKLKSRAFVRIALITTDKEKNLYRCPNSRNQRPSWEWSVQ